VTAAPLDQRASGSRLVAADARVLLDDISDIRSWAANSYAERARSLLEES
jgi:hypothetical protein